MSFRDHSLDNIWIRCRSVDRTFSKVVAGDKECRMEAELLQDVQKLIGVQIWAVIVSQSDNFILDTIIYVGVIRDFPQKRSRIV